MLAGTGKPASQVMAIGKGTELEGLLYFQYRSAFSMAVRQATSSLEDILSNLHGSSLSRLLLILAENVYPERGPRFSPEEQKPHWWPAEITYTHPYNMTKEGQYN